MDSQGTLGPISHLPLPGWLPRFDAYDAVPSVGRLMGLQRHLSLPLAFRNRQAEKAGPRIAERGTANPTSSLLRFQ